MCAIIYPHISCVREENGESLSPLPDCYQQEIPMQDIGIGTDIEEVRRFENHQNPPFAAFLKKNFTRVGLHDRL